VKSKYCTRNDLEFGSLGEIHRGLFLEEAHMGLFLHQALLLKTNKQKYVSVSGLQHSY